MTKDFPYPEELRMMDSLKKLEKLEKYYYEHEEFCECHARCPKCGKKYRRPLHYSDVKE